MDNLSYKDLATLSEQSSGPCVSLYMPTHRRGREIEQDPIRFKNMLNQAEEDLLATGMRGPVARKQLEPAQRLLQDPVFWSHLSDGLAVFLAPDASYYYRLALSFDQMVVVSDRFHLKPLMPFFSTDGRFYILALSQKEVRLLHATRHTVNEVDLAGLLPGLAQALRYEEYERHLQAHSSVSSGPGQRQAMFHGHNPGDDTRDRIRRWFQTVDGELVGLLRDSKSPVVLAGVESLLSAYREVTDYAHVVEEGVTGNPETLRPEELHAEAWPLVEPAFMVQREADASRYRELAGTGRTTDDVAEAVRAAHQGRVDALFAEVGAQAWGRFDPDTGALELHDDPERGDGDLIDLAAILTMQNSGSVYVLPAAEVPNGGPVAAVFRY